MIKKWKKSYATFLLKLFLIEMLKSKDIFRQIWVYSLSQNSNVFNTKNHKTPNKIKQKITFFKYITHINSLGYYIKNVIFYIASWKSRHICLVKINNLFFFLYILKKKAYCIYNTVEQKKSGREKNGNQE